MPHKLRDIHWHRYRRYVAEDLEGHQWTFARARRTTLAGLITAMCLEPAG